MQIEVLTVGGYNEVGKNMTAVKVGDDVVIFDAGLYLPAVIEIQESEAAGPERFSYQHMKSVGAVPEDSILEQTGWRNKVRALCVSHAHLDHVGAVPYNAPNYKAEVVGTPFTTTILRKLMEDEGQVIPNPIRSIAMNGTYTVKGKRSYEIEFLNMTHSTPQTAILALHTPEGAIIYANDYKLDNTPVLGAPPNYQALRKIAKEGVKALIIDSLYAGSERKTPSEKVARDLLEEVMLTINNEHNGIVVSTFSSHIARLKSIVDFGRKLDREVIFLGRSMKKYVDASLETNICPFKNQVRMGSYKKQVSALLKKANKEKDKYLVVCTGHQGEPGSILERLSRNELPYQFKKSDHVLFASKTIPVPINMANKEKMQSRLRKANVRIFEDLHTSGHGGREDARDLIELLNPEHLIPSHGDMQKLIPMMELAKELGYKMGKNCHLMQNAQRLVI